MKIAVLAGVTGLMIYATSEGQSHGAAHLLWLSNRSFS
jgi:hypothetical protein